MPVMLPAEQVQRSRSYQIGRAAYLAGDFGRLPASLAPLLQAEQRHAEMRGQASWEVTLQTVFPEWDEVTKRKFKENLFDEIRARGESMADKKYTHQQVATYIRKMVSEKPSYDAVRLTELAEKIEMCHSCGTVGICGDGSLQTAWDCKCGLAKLCEFEANQFTKKLSNRLIEPMLHWLKGSMTRRVFYAVFAPPNCEVNQLRQGQREAVDRIKDKVLKARRPVTEKERHDNGWSKQRKWIDCFPTIKGSLLALEDPLSAQGDWNVHVNALLFTDGALNFEELRKAYGYNVEIREVKGRSLEALTASLVEVIKYSVKTAHGKSTEKRERDETEAPPMVEWPYERWMEWHKANQGFRRVRTFGILYKIKSPADKEKKEVAAWIGAFRWHPSGRYEVDLIPEDNFSLSTPAMKAKFECLEHHKRNNQAHFRDYNPPPN